MYRRDERGARAERGVEDEAHGDRQMRIEQGQRAVFREQFGKCRKLCDVNRTGVLFDELADALRIGVRRTLEIREADRFAGLIYHAERAVVRAERFERAL